jgi:uncharacterized repeat protein (TIGR01451 family)
MNSRKLQFVLRILFILAFICSNAAIAQRAEAASPHSVTLAPQSPDAPCTLAFPFSETFTNSLATLRPDWKLAGNTSGLPMLTGTGSPDPAGNGWLRLTDLGNNEASSAYYDCAIPTARGLVIEFDYATWGGSGADGLSFFLFDGATTTFGVGANGGSLGYAQKTGINGMNGGYLGLGIDEFGNFSNPTEGRIGGPGSRPDSIALRGPGSGTSGYDYLSGTATLSTSIDTPNVTTRPSQTGSGYRHIKINLDPSGSTYQVTASITFGTGGGARTSSTTPYTMTAPTPATLKMGFAASTGGSTNYHEIRNLTVNPSVPDITAVKTVAVVGGGSAVPGAQLLYTVTLINQLTTSGVTNLSFSDAIPANTTYVANSVAIPSGASLTATSPTLTVTWISLAAAGQATITFRVQINSPLAGGVTAISNQGTVTGTFNGTAINTSTDSDVTTPALDPTLMPVVAGPNYSNMTKTVAIAGGGSTVSPGSTLTYTVTIPNSGNQHALSTSFTDVLPAGTTYVAGSASASSGSIGYNAGLGRIEWTGGINSGSQVVLIFRAAVNSGVRIHQVISNQGSLSYSSNGGSTPDSSLLTDSDPGTPGRQPTNVVVAGSVTLQAYKSALDLNGGAVTPGDTLRYTVSIVNPTAYTLDGVELLDALDPDLAYVAGSLGIPGGSVVSTTPIDVSGISLPPNAQVQVTFDALLTAALPAGVTQVSNQGSVRYSSSGDAGYNTTLLTDANPATPAVQEPTVNLITASPAFSPTKSVAVVGGGDPIHGSVLAYTLTFQNTGNMAATGASFSDSLEGIRNYVDYVAGSLTASRGTAGYNATLNQVEWNGDLGVGEAVTLSFSVRIKDLVGAGVDIANTGTLAYNRLSNGVLVPGGPQNSNTVTVRTSAPILNYGDLPVDYHLTSLADNGARHVIPVTGGIMLGAGMRSGQDGVARGMDSPRPATPDDGISRLANETWAAGQTVHLEVMVSGPTGASATLVGWFDWNGDRAFSSNERVVFPDSLKVGDNHLMLVLPGPDQFTLQAGETIYARFRLYAAPPSDPQPTGEVVNGEVEDYQWPGGPTAVDLVSFTAAWQLPVGVQIQWTTAQETSTLGFNIYRQEGDNSPFVRLNTDLIPVQSPGGLTGSNYVFTDSTAQPGVHYTYKLEEVDANLGVHEYGTLNFSNYPIFLPLEMK